MNKILLEHRGGKGWSSLMKSRSIFEKMNSSIGDEDDLDITRWHSCLDDIARYKARYKKDRIIKGLFFPYAWALGKQYTSEEAMRIESF